MYWGLAHLKRTRSTGCSLVIYDFPYVLALIPIGAAFGAVGSGPLLAKLSRKYSLIFTDILGIIGLGFSLISNLNTLFVARFIIGVAVGLNSSLVPLYIKEYTPLILRGSMGSMN
jgi:SP family galactose:H+ symporter-like MFS transporter